MSVSDTGHRGTQLLSPAFVLVILLVSCLLVVAALVPHDRQQGLRAAELSAVPGAEANPVAAAGDIPAEAGSAARPAAVEAAITGTAPVQSPATRPTGVVPPVRQQVRVKTAAAVESLTGFDGMAALRAPAKAPAVTGVQRDAASDLRKSPARATQLAAGVVTAAAEEQVQTGQVQRVSHAVPVKARPAAVTEPRGEPAVDDEPAAEVARRDVAVAPAKVARTDPAPNVTTVAAEVSTAIVPEAAVPDAVKEPSAEVPGNSSRPADVTEEPARDRSLVVPESTPAAPLPGTVRINYAGFRTAVLPPAPAEPPVTKPSSPVVAVKPEVVPESEAVPERPAAVAVVSADSEDIADDAEDADGQTGVEPQQTSAPETLTEAEPGADAAAVEPTEPDPAPQVPAKSSAKTEEEERNGEVEEDVQTVAGVGPALAPGAVLPPPPAAAVPGRQVPAAAPPGAGVPGVRPAPGPLPGAVVPVAPAPAPLPLPLHDTPAASGPAPVLGNDTVEPLLPEGEVVSEVATGGGVPSSQVVGVEVFETDPHAPILPADVAARAMKALEVQGQQPCCEVPGLGTIRAPFAVFDLDPARPQNALRLRFDSAAGINRPDRNEYFWGKIGGKGPGLAERNVDYGEFSVYSESMIGNSSGFIEMPLRFIDPEVNDGSSGPGLLTLGTKSLIFEGDGAFGFETPGTPNDSFQLSTVFRTSLSFSPRWAARGLNSGHMALEPGLLATYQRSLRTVFHGELKYWIPLGADSDFANGVLRYGVGVSRVLKQSPPDDPHCRKYALIPTLELVGMNFSGGLQTMPDGSVVAADTGAIVNVIPGMRVVLGDHVEVGGSSAFVLTNTRYYESLHRLELRWFW